MFCQFSVDTTQVGVNDYGIDYSKMKNSFFVQKNNSNTLYFIHVKNESEMDTLKEYHKISDSQWERFGENNVIERGNFKVRKMKKRHDVYKLFPDRVILKQIGEWTYLDKTTNKTYVVKYK